MAQTDVLVVGAGPTGLLLAGDLARAGVRCTLLERRREESNLTRAFAVHARTLEELDARGVADELVATGERVNAIRAFGRVEVDLSRLSTRFPYVLVTPQYETERVLADRARSEGVEIVTDAEVVGLTQQPDGVSVEVHDSDGVPSIRSAAYVVGTDGVGSTVRRALGLSFPGRSAVQSVMLADVRLREPPAEVLTVDATRDGFAFLAPFGDGWYRVIAWRPDRQAADSEPVELTEIRETTRSVHGTDFGMHDPRWLSRFHSDERQVTRYRVGRVLLAGDAAHVHSPAGGQGMNTGIQDAANLGWKLAAVVRGRAPEGMLDSYHAERHPVGRAVLRGSGALLRVALARSPLTRAARWVMKRIVGPRGLVPPRAARAVSGLGVSYPAPRGSHPMVGKPARDLRLAATTPGAVSGTHDEPRRLHEALRDGRFVLVRRGDRPDLPLGWDDRVVTATSVGDPPAPVMLVRPDGYVAWASDEASAAGVEPKLREALARWCGAPATA